MGKNLIIGILILVIIGIVFYYENPDIFESVIEDPLSEILNIKPKTTPTEIRIDSGGKWHGRMDVCDKNGKKTASLLFGEGRKKITVIDEVLSVYLDNDPSSPKSWISLLIKKEDKIICSIFNDRGPLNWVKK